MARTTATNFSGALQFPYATAATDLFHKEDVQVVAQAVDQHDHTSGKGLPVSLTHAVDIPDWYRSTGHTSAFATSGAGIELYYDAVTGGFLSGYTRPSGPWVPVTISGSTFTVAIGGVGNAMTILADRSVQFAGPAVTMTAVNMSGGLTVGASVAVSGTLHVVQATTLDAGLIAGANELTVVTSTSVTVGHQFSVGGASFFTGPITSNAHSCTTLTASGAVTGTNHVSTAAASAGAGQIAYGNGIGQGNGGAAGALPLLRGTGFGPTTAAATGWIQGNAAGTMIYWPYWT